MIQYSILNDIASQTVDPEKLGQEIVEANCVSDFNGINITGDVLSVLCGNVSDLSLLNSTVHTHVAKSLADKKAEKIIAIDDKTDSIIAQGFTFDGQQFSLSTQAQTNWLGLAALQAFISWPINVTTHANTSYLLTLLNMPSFIGTGMATIQGAIGSGRALKIAVNNAADQAALDAVVDTR